MTETISGWNATDKLELVADRCPVDRCPVDRCPACRARFRGARICSRCGADLGRPMVLTAEAWRLREAARSAIAAGDFTLGFELARKAQEAQSTKAGDVLCRISGWLKTGDVPFSGIDR